MLRLNHPLVLVCATGALAVGLSLAVFIPRSRERVPAALTAVAGLEQSAPVGELVERPISVVVSDAVGRALPGVSVTFEVLSGGGRLLTPAAVTGPDGIATNGWTLGYFVGEQQLVEARVDVPATGTRLTARIRATAVPGAPATLVKEPSLDAARTALAGARRRLAVRVLDRYGNPVPGAETTWTVSGGGSVARTSPASDEGGIARGVWTLGSGSLRGQVVRVAAGPAVTEFRVGAAGGEERLFSDDFEAGLSKWTDGPHRAHSAEIVRDPRSPRNSVLRFRRLGAGADLLSLAIPSTAGATYRLRFDYLGTPTGATGNDSGGYIGITDAVRGRQLWLAGTDPANAPLEVEDDGAWHTYSVAFSMEDGLEPGDMRIMLEDFDAPRGRAGDAYFDDIEVLEGPPTG